MLDRLHVRLKEYTGVRAVRLSDSAGASIPEHAHDWPVLSLFLAGSYENWSEIGKTVVSRPSAMFYRAGERHSNMVGSFGLEQIDLEFDPSWLGLTWKASWSPVANWNGGAAGLRTRNLCRLWLDPAAQEASLVRATREFLIRCFDDPPVREPAWLGDALRLMEETDAVTAPQIARSLDLHPGWFAEAYRAAMGEGIRETIRRRRVEKAVQLLVDSGEPQAGVAVAAGFCDQSHMIRCFHAVLGRTPDEVRRERRSDRKPVSLS